MQDTSAFQCSPPPNPTTSPKMSQPTSLATTRTTRGPRRRVLASGLSSLPDEKLTGFALRLALTGHTDIPRENDFDFLLEAESIFIPHQPKKKHAAKKAEAKKSTTAKPKTTSKKSTKNAVVTKKQIAA